MKKSQIESAEKFGARIDRGKCHGCSKRRVLFAPNPTFPKEVVVQSLCAECLLEQAALVRAGVKTNKKPQKKSQKAANGLAEGLASLPSVGSTVWWTIHENEIARPDLEVILKDTLGSAFIPREPQKKRAVRLALIALEEAGLIRKIRDDDVLTAYQLVHEHTDVQNLDIEFEKKNLVVWDKSKGELDIRYKYKATKIKELFDRYASVYTQDDFRSIAIRFVKDNAGVTLRESGGIYFLPGEEAVEKLEGFLDSVGADFYGLPILDCGLAKKQLFEHVQVEMERDVELAAERVKEMIASDRTRESTFVSQIDSFKKLRGKCEMYSELLKADAEVIADKIEKLQAEVQKALEEGIEKYPEDVRKFEIDMRVKYSGRMVSKVGEFGRVVGYVMDQKRAYVKVLMDKTQKVQPAAASSLEEVK
jgi:hypothetical protein